MNIYNIYLNYKICGEALHNSINKTITSGKSINKAKTFKDDYTFLQENIIQNKYNKTENINDNNNDFNNLGLDYIEEGDELPSGIDHINNLLKSRNYERASNQSKYFNLKNDEYSTNRNTNNNNSNNNNNNNVYENIIFPEPDHLEIILPNNNNSIEENNNK